MWSLLLKSSQSWAYITNIQVDCIKSVRTKEDHKEDYGKSKEKNITFTREFWKCFLQDGEGRTAFSFFYGTKENREGLSLIA